MKFRDPDGEGVAGLRAYSKNVCFRMVSKCAHAVLS